jgi:archaellum biogenesis protein FlaJ (TadC family)
MRNIKEIFKGLKEIIDNWKTTYNKLYVISHSEAKQSRFYKILQRMGYTIREENIQGKRVGYI